LPKQAHDLLRRILLPLRHSWLLPFQFLAFILVQKVPGTPRGPVVLFPKMCFYCGACATSSTKLR
jgi:hypothetical protein